MSGTFVAYYRVSTQKQGQSGLGLEAQRDAVRRYVLGVGGMLLSEHTEVESGKVSTRPVLADAIADCRKHKAVLVIAKLDRLARNVAFVSSLMDGGVEFVAVDMPTANRLVLHILAAVAENERELISQRTKVALAAAKARGVLLGKNGQVLASQNIATANDFAAQMREEIASIAGQPGITLQMIADGLNDRGHVTREGCRWGPASVQRTMKRLGLRTAAMGPT